MHAYSEAWHAQNWYSDQNVAQKIDLNQHCASDTQWSRQDSALWPYFTKQKQNTNIWE